jgi:protein-S-isoprenylcysteine O-methyltransferase Ste14
MNARLLSIAGFVIAVAGIIGMLLRQELLSASPIGLAFQIAAIGLMIWARVTFGTRSFHAAADPTEGGLVTSGPYAHVRHPIYAAVLLFCWAGALSAFTLPAACGALVVSAGMAIRMLQEEKLVAARYPEYAEYARRTKRIIPHVL